MADPVITPCAKDVWTKVATNVTSGQFHIKDTRPGVYLQTYRDTGNPAPTLQSEGVQVSGPSTDILAVSGIDVYLMPLNAAGSVRVDV